VNRRIVRCLLDNGSRHSLVSLSWCESHNIKIQPLQFGHQNQLWVANGSALKVHGTTKLEIRIKGLLFPHEFLIISDLSDNVILGTDFMEAYHVTLDYAHGTVQLDDLICVPIASKQSRQRIVRTVNSIFVPAYSEAIIPITVNRRFIGHNILLEAPPTQQFEKFATARIIVKPKSVNTICRILNHNSYAIVLRRRECVAIVSDVMNDDELPVSNRNTVNRLSSEVPTTQPITPSVNSQTTPPTREILDEFLKQTGITIADKAPLDDRYELAKLLFEFQDLFKSSVKDIHQCNVPPFDINLRSNKGAFTRQYKLSVDDAAEVEKQVKDMLHANIIEPATGIETSKYNAPAFLVPKRGSTAKRLVMDYRKLNSIVDPVIFNLPPVNDLVAEVAATKPKWLSSVDVISFFWQLPLSEQSRKYTTFTAPSGQKYNFRVTPFGLCNSPGYASLTLLSVLDRLKGRIAYYVDDILATSQTISGHIDVLRDLFTELRKANLSLNAKKCTFLDDSATYLSHKITKDGYSLLSKYSTDVIRNWGSPKSANALCRWLNATGWFRRHIPAFAKRTASLRQLLKPDVIFEWTSNHEKIFRDINNCIINPPILRPLENTGPIYILTDASTEGCAFMIGQKGADNKLYPCLFGGQALTNPQTRWPPYQLEIFSLIQALQTHYSLLSGRQIIAVTDNASLQSFNSLHLGSPRLRRWNHLMCQFHISLVHLPGKNNTLLDAISRQFEDMPPAVKLQFTPQEDETNDYILRVTDDTPTYTRHVTDQIDRRTEIDSNSHTDIDSLFQSTDTDSDMTNNVTTGHPDSLDIVPPPIQFMDSQTSHMSTDNRDNALNPHALPFTPTDSKDNDHATTIHAVSTRHKTNRRRQDTTVNSDQQNDTNIPDTTPAHNTDSDNNNENQEPVTHDDITDPDSPDIPSELDAEPDLHITLEDYQTDPEFRDIIEYKLHGTLTGHDATDRKILFTEDSYFITNEKLYRVTEPRAKRKRNVTPVHTRLCIPRRFQFQTVENYHKLLNHAGHVNLLETVRPRIYFRDLPLLCLEIPKTCDRCSMVKRNQSVPRQPLHPREVNGFNKVWHCDHLKLSRPTSPSGFTHIFVAIEQFSSWLEAALCYGTSAKESALRIMETIISRHGVPDTIICDRATSFHNHLMTHLSQLLNVRISFAAAKNPMANSKVEREVARIKQAIKVHLDSDPEVETMLPTILLGLRVTRTRSTDTTPFYLAHGFHPSLPVLGSGSDDPSSSQTTLTSHDRTFLQNLTKQMRELHAKVKTNIEEYKGQMKQQYDKEFKTAPAPYKEGSRVWLHTPQIKAGSRSVLTHKQWSGPYFVTNVHKQPNGEGGTTYILTHCKTGRNHPHPVSALRLKPAHSREALIERLYPEKAKPIALAETQAKTQTDCTANATSKAAANQSEPENSLPPGYEPAKRILRQRKFQGKLQFLVEFEQNAGSYWCDSSDVSELLVKHFRLLQAKRRNRRRRTKKY